MLPDLLGGGGTVAAGVPQAQPAPPLSEPLKPTTAPAASLPLTEAAGKLRGGCKGGKAF